jgi:hypothetical protein
MNETDEREGQSYQNIEQRLHHFNTPAVSHVVVTGK